MDRVRAVDIFRGMAVVQMIALQMFDFFSRTDIYSDSPYFIKIFNMPFNGIGVVLFAFIAGSSLYLSYEKWRIRKKSNKWIEEHVAKRMLKLLLISLLFTVFVWDFCRYFGWDEALQGIAAASIISFCIFMLIKSNKILALAIFALITLQFPLVSYITSQGVTNVYVVCSQAFNASTIASFFLNISSRGFFSLIHLVPLVLSGVILGRMITRKDVNMITKIKIVSVGLILFSLFMHFTGVPIDYYNRSPSYVMFILGIAAGIYCIIAYLLEHKGNVTGFNQLEIFGKAAILAYLGHFVLVYKPLEIMHLDGTFDDVTSWIASIVLLIVMYYILKWWITRKEKIYGPMHQELEHLAVNS